MGIDSYTDWFLNHIDFTNKFYSLGKDPLIRGCIDQRVGRLLYEEIQGSLH